MRLGAPTRSRIHATKRTSDFAHPHDQERRRVHASAQSGVGFHETAQPGTLATSHVYVTKRADSRACPPADPPLIAVSTPAHRGKVAVMEQLSPNMERRVEKRRAREKKTISQMIAMHCAGTHHAVERTERAFCGDAVCPACAKLDAYAVLRTERCRKMHVKTSCEACENHCYAPEMRESIRAAMRYSGPRMIFKHPVAAIRHLLGR